MSFNIVFCVLLTPGRSGNKAFDKNNSQVKNLFVCGVFVFFAFFLCFALVFVNVCVVACHNLLNFGAKAEICNWIVVFWLG